MGKIKWKSILANVFKTILGILGFYLIFRLVQNQAGKDSHSILALFQNPDSGWILLGVLALMVLNWFLEALKWEYLVGKVEKLSLGQSVQSLLAGLNLAIYTPGRIGEYGGRILYLKPENRKEGALCILVGNLSQLLVTLLFGFFGLGLWAYNFIKVPNWLFWLCGSGLFLLSLLCIWFFFSLNNLEGLWSRFPFLKDRLKSFQVLNQFSGKEFRMAMGFSLARYIVFSNQYILLLFGLMGAHSYALSFATLSLVFMIQSLVPSFVLADMGIRGATSIYFFSFVFGKQNIIPILASSFIVWFVNIILPATLGLYFVLKIKPRLGNV